MAAAQSIIYQFKITLKDSKPKIWRRIQVPSTYRFSDLHAVIQNAMGWMGGHLHQFNMKHPVTGRKIQIGEPHHDDAVFGMDIIPEERAKIAQYFIAAKKKAFYLYDFGDGWYHEVVLEKIIAPEANVQYPRCVAGKRACPPEDCGGISGYENLLHILADPAHDEHKERMEWMEDIGMEDFDPEAFDSNSVNFFW